MTRLDIYNIALGQHGRKCTQSDIESQNPPYDVELCNRYYDAAVKKVLGEEDWSFLLRKLEIEDLDDDEPTGKWAHGFLLPKRIMRVSKLSTKPYMLIGGRFLTDEDEPDIYVMSDNFDPENAPDDICQLIGLALAYQLCGILAPANSALSQLILQNYTWILQPMISSEATSIIRTPEEGGPVAL